MQDFLVIGGGIAGISTAARLSSLGKVTVLEAQNGLGYHASGRSAAVFEETYGLASTVALNRASRDYLTNANGGVLSPRGLLLVGSHDTRPAFAHDLHAMQLARISLDAALAMVPILNPGVICEAGYHADALDIDTDRLIQNFARETRASGGKVLVNHTVDSIERNKTCWQVASSGRDFKARILVNAAGAWVDQIAVMAGIAPLGFTPMRRSIARIAAPAGIDVKSWPLIFGPGESWYAKPDAGMLLVSPADEDPTEPHDAWPEDITLATGVARFERVTTHTVTRIDSAWAGLRTFSPDRSLVLGPDTVDPTFVWTAGQGGYGFQTSPAASQLVADLIADRQNPLDQAIIRALSPSRFS